ncbi:phosphoenolpyruvate synthase [Candidatus Acetothermia bacterium]|nr:phosphoenolpyruvate synthase [Candidatus Acetothermia bacterium]
MTRIVTPENLGKGEALQLGGKAKNLFILSRLRLNVPLYFVISTELFREVFSSLSVKIHVNFTELDFKNAQAVAQASAQVRTLVETVELSALHKSEVIEAYQRCFSSQDFVAVRSSAVGEDAHAQSFAGQFDSFLFVRGEENLLSAIKKCWASAFSERALVYRHLNGFDLSALEVAVIVQKMIDGNVSGVTFTADPISGDERTLLINATYGLGEGIVSGKLDTDSYSVKKSDLSLCESKIAEKAMQIVFAQTRGQGTTEISVEPSLQTAPCLSQSQIHELADLALKVEQHYGRPQDIEWTIDDKIYILQTRPITTLKPKGYRLIWDNSNIIESYSGVTTPLTYSFAREAYASVYRQFCEVCGVSDEKILQNEETFQNMIGLIKGRVYYNLKNWYRVLSLFPGFQYNKQFMEQMMGVKEALDYQTDARPMTWTRKYFVELPQLLKLSFRMSNHLRHSEHLVADFQQLFNVTLEEYRQRDFDSLEVNELIEIYDELKRKLLWNWKAPIINDFFAMLFYGVLKKLCVSWIGDEAGTLQNDLLCGEGGVESTEPTKAIMKLALEVRSNPALQELFEKPLAEQILLRLRREPAFAAFHRKIEDYLEKYGSRCMNELKLEEKTLKDDPSFLFTMILNYLQRPDLNIEAMEACERAIRQKAEQTVAERLRFPKRQIFNWVLRRARQYVKNRENLRFARTRIFGVVRELFNAMGQRFYEKKILDEPRDIYSLNVEEIFGFVKGTATSTNLKGLVALHKEEFERYRHEPAPADRFETVGMVWDGNTFESHRTDLTHAAEDSHTLRGIGCCPGVVKGVTKHVTSPQDAKLNGEILVAERTDPGWVPLFPTASGILIERGSILSHSAIVARELGIPTIVGIKDLTKRVQSGQSVEMDGAQGVVKL